MPKLPNSFVNLVIVLCLFLNVRYAGAQNLVPNGGFETMTSKTICPNRIGEIMLAEDWFVPNLTTPDLFGTCAGKNLTTGIPKNNRGYQKCDSGNYYAGIICFIEGMVYKEYMSIKLSMKLKKGKTYCVQYNYSLANNSGYKFNSLGAIFTNEKPQIRNKAPINRYSISKPIVNDTAQWQKLAAFYTADGTEKYITIGSFSNEMETIEVYFDPETVTSNELAGAATAYYFIDNVSVIETNDEAACKCSVPLKKEEPIVIKEEEKLQQEVSYTFKELRFEVNKSEIDPVSYKELDSLANYLKNHPLLKIIISGHTDNSGKESDNLILSTNRAKAVSDYLMSKGIPEQCISYKGYGSSKALFSDDSEQHKSANRRVEFILQEK